MPPFVENFSWHMSLASLTTDALMLPLPRSAMDTVLVEGFGGKVSAPTVSVSLLLQLHIPAKGLPEPPVLELVPLQPNTGANIGATATAKKAHVFLMIPMATSRCVCCQPAGPRGSRALWHRGDRP